MNFRTSGGASSLAGVGIRPPKNNSPIPKSLIPLTIIPLTQPALLSDKVRGMIVRGIMDCLFKARRTTRPTRRLL
jgi:hypothetical protein